MKTVHSPVLYAKSSMNARKRNQGPSLPKSILEHIDREESSAFIGRRTGTFIFPARTPGSKKDRSARSARQNTSQPKLLLQNARLRKSTLTPPKPNEKRRFILQKMSRVLLLLPRTRPVLALPRRSPTLVNCLRSRWGSPNKSLQLSRSLPQSRCPRLPKLPSVS
ncbi:hypothetical protein BS17DRAFT_118486 [Gyrodon lividus]|nr:hypothetical protein BS17DRAFT_118486 [Gyrodon lividus]